MVRLRRILGESALHDSVRTKTGEICRLERVRGEREIRNVADAMLTGREAEYDVVRLERKVWRECRPGADRGVNRKWKQMAETRGAGRNLGKA